ncbi:HrcA family transcriptional regulator [Fervidicella metallireducens AeB]|uniref:Heat-inducible transcription repressor HrcA n=1 Tax=Fervidicella metallireducens AeB TaxID=1403537 RepID=A0A017RW30_9CLOT|nr:heat-inducible transcriptional repressor HrcA [Fervidicella metallireducens]EYE88110.1 HrcA family transcriptional regulator [Fervidicella metallireducens AeB]
MDLGERKKLILRAIVNDYIQTAEPVGSRSISKKQEIGISSATIRNEMADLEELGYLQQPHTSAGRIPSDKGYRFYVNELMEVNVPTVKEIEYMKNMMQLVTVNEINKIIKRMTKMLSQITCYTSAIVTPSVKNSSVKSIQLIHVTSNDIVAVIVTDTGIIKNFVINTPRSITNDTLIKINNMLNEKLSGLTLNEINLEVISSIQSELRGYTEILNAIIPALYECLTSMDCDVFLEGVTNIFKHPEYKDIEKAENFLSILDKKDIIKKILTVDDNNYSVYIGNENIYDGIKDCSIVKATYRINNKTVGHIGVIGPTRMDYGKVIGTLKLISTTINDMLKNTSKE